MPIAFICKVCGEKVISNDMRRNTCDSESCRAKRQNTYKRDWYGKRRTKTRYEVQRKPRFCIICLEELPLGSYGRTLCKKKSCLLLNRKAKYLRWKQRQERVKK